ncbi:MAG TPA: type II CRISPR-associated endonuclease Cas1 [Candidatus Caccosoma faecigallinarum]|uniref:CRISPR-associated endonuclease Cas1 n=1 Tax=Candidatus Caccosoma faecigallinarum TaxID=2840720 RepID=A0A9D1G9G6_9FIRM|nr:type II CRISPR-associated endonuclease Cas1 [Candidatus Caccosoma faecigallinarum]
MGFRTVIVSSHSKLEYALNYLVYKTVDEVKRIHIHEIHTLIIESTTVSITSALLAELIKQKVKVIFCDEKRNPSSELIPYYGDSISYQRINEQIKWKENIKHLVWQKIVQEKIKQQAFVLSKKMPDEAIILSNYAKEVELDDVTNREGHAAKFYFNRLYGENFSRGSSDKINTFLNYGYTLLLSQFNRYIVAKGYLTQLGIHHKNPFNPFNLSCDLMEPFRPFIDLKVIDLSEDNFKNKLISFLNHPVYIHGKKQTLIHAIQIYCSSIFLALNTGKIECIQFLESYE